MKKKVLLLGAAGNVGAELTPRLEPYYDLRKAEFMPQLPEGMISVDVSQYDQVLEAARGMDAILNLTVNRQDPTLSFQISTRGAWHVMKAAAELGIKKVLHTGPELTYLPHRHDFDIVPGTVVPIDIYYAVSKLMAADICRIYAQTYRINTISYLFRGFLDDPTEPVAESCEPEFCVVWSDLLHACRLALEIESVPDYFQQFHVMSYTSQGRYDTRRLKQIIGFEPVKPWVDYYKRIP